jgi:hypothetical protein
MLETAATAIRRASGEIQKPLCPTEGERLRYVATRMAAIEEAVGFDIVMFQRVLAPKNRYERRVRSRRI